MAKVDIPTDQIRGASLQLNRTEVITEMLNGKEVIAEFPRQFWSISFDVITLTKEQAGAWRGPLSRLSRRSNFFELTPPEYQGTAYTGSLTVVGSGAVGTSVLVQGVPDTTVLKAGDYFELRGELKIVVEDCATDAQGLAELQFEPTMRAVLQNNDALNIQTPKGKFRLADSRAAWQIGQGLFQSVQVDAIEVIE